MSMLREDVTVRRLIQLRRDRVFDAFTTPDALSKWFSPSAEIGIEIETFEFVPKGEFRICYTMNDESTPAAKGIYETIDVPREIVFTWEWEAPDDHAGIPTRVRIQFFDRGGDTEVVLTHEKLPTDAHERHAIGWNATLERLERFFISS